MPAKLRTSKMRNALITPEAVALFRRGLELQKIGADEINYDGEENSPEQDEYHAIERRLHWTLLGLIGDAGPLDVEPGRKYCGAECWMQSVPKALELRRLLRATDRRRRK
jgi:hypothetical protein